MHGAEQSAAATDPLLAAMTAELRRSQQGLRVPGNPRPYYLRYALRRERELLIEAAHGSLLRRRDKLRGRLEVEVRVGSHEFDNVFDGGLDGDQSERESADWLLAPDDLEPMALRCALWKLTQMKFDEALEDYYDHRKAMVAEYLRDEVASFTREQATRHLEALDDSPLPIERWSQELVELSRRLLDHPEIHDPTLSIRGERIHRWLVDTEGSLVRTSDLWLEFEVRGFVLTDDGVYVEAARAWPARTLDEMLDAAAMARLFDEVVAELHELREADSPGSFIGPALLSGQAASTMFHEALGHRVEGNRLGARGETRTFARMLGERILPPGLHVFDDPTLTEHRGHSLWGSYRIDDEGVPAQRAELVRDGLLVGFLRNRTPLPDQSSPGRGGEPPKPERSNGHGRSAGVERPMARMGNLIVESEASHDQDQAALERELIELARASGRRHAALIHRVRAGETATDSYDFQVFKGELAHVELLDVETGARRRVRDLELIGTPLSALQRIVSFGGEPGVDHGHCYAESGSVPVGGAAPAIVLSEVELQQASRTGFHEPLLPPPFADDGSGGRTGRLRERGRRRRRR
ncbi:protease TldD [Enhygromyxa salina]|uniref:Protease TldD n=1 Tax=Enhygromyxa salina TaxID=215803 RepID=A0A2S9XGH2_9BACT|nr:metallopeptidase TldD-related protein [Enhygromyxa salina]PRP91963.1 protease TldD [Enhygromyxa salina]